jgi:hypothetical protein
MLLNMLLIAMTELMSSLLSNNTSSIIELYEAFYISSPHTRPIIDNQKVILQSKLCYHQGTLI